MNLITALAIVIGALAAVATWLCLGTPLGLQVWALFIGWAAGMAYGTWLAYGVPLPGDPGSHFGGPLVLFPGAETTKVYIALLAIIANLVVSVVLTFVFRAMGVDEGVDQTKDDDYWADLGDEGVEPELDPLMEPHR